MLELHAIELLSHRFVDHVPISTSDWIHRCAIVRWFDENTLTTFARVDDPSAILEGLSRLSFVEGRGHRFAFHDLFRASLCRKLLHQDPTYYFQLHREAADYYSLRMLSSSRGTAQQFVIEMIYHLTRADEDEGITQLKSIVLSARAFSQTGLAIALFETMNGLTLSHENRTWVEHSKYSILEQNRVPI